MYSFAEKYYEKKRINEASSAFMKFPNDIKQAEVLTNGNPKIVENEKYQPKKPVPAQAKYELKQRYIMSSVL